MGTDIHIHMEYRSRKKKQYQYGGRMQGERLYGVFEVFAGVRLGSKQLIKPRGLPGDVTKVVLQAYHEWKPDCHHASWLTTEELRDCLDEAQKRLLAAKETTDEEWLRPYERIYEYMIDYERAGEPCRIVFWFDN